MKENQKIIIFFFVLFSKIVTGNPKGISTLPSFIENKGQWDKEAMFLSKMNNTNSWILENGSLLIDFYKITIRNSADITSKYHEVDTSRKILGHKVLLNWGNTNQITYSKDKPNEGYTNYLKGNDTAKYAKNVKSFNEIKGHSLYNGIDIKYYFDNNNLRYDLIAEPYANIEQINLSVEGAEQLKIDTDGSVIITTSIGEVKMKDLYVYEFETKKQINCKWKLSNGNELTLSIGNYDKSKTLIIDPLIYSTFLGGSSYQISRSIASDRYGNAYITGETSSPDFFVTTGAYQTSLASQLDVFIAKLNSSGTNYIYCTYLGGTNTLPEQAFDIAIDTLGNAFITGYTMSSDFPITPGAYQPVFDNAQDVFVTKINSTGTSLVYSTYIGGGGNEIGYSIAVDKQGFAYITGKTSSVNYDVTPGAFQTLHLNFYDAFVTKINLLGTGLVYSTYLNGSSQDYGYGICVDSLGFAYVTGETISDPSNFLTPGVHFSGAGGYNVFVTKMNLNGTARVYSTFIGGTGATLSVNSKGNGIAVDQQGNAYVVGSTLANNFDITPGAFQTVKGDTLLNEAFVFKLNSNATALIYSTYIGGANHDMGNDISIDNYNCAYITGQTHSLNFPITSDGVQLSHDGSIDAFFSRLSSNGNVLQYSTYLGGVNNDFGHGIAQLHSSEVFLTGKTNSANYDLTSGVIEENYYNSETGFVTKLSICPPINFNLFTVATSCSGSNDGMAFVSDLDTGLLNYTMIWSNGQAGDSLMNVSAGNYYVTIAIQNGCSVTDTFTINQPPPITATISTSTNNICTGDTISITANSSLGLSASFQWQVNSNNVGSNSSNLLYAPENGDTIICIVSSSVNCDINSNFIVINASSVFTPSIIINSASVDTICAGTLVEFNSTITNGGSAPVYQWQINGINAGTNDSTFSTSNLNNGDLVTCILNSSYSCLTSNNVISNSMQFQVASGVIASVSISTDTTTICSGSTIVFNANTINGGINPSYQWQLNGTNVGINSSVYTSSSLSNGDNVSVVLNSNANCVDNPIANSNVITMMVNPCLLPIAAFASSNSQICINECVEYTSTTVNNPTSWQWQFQGGSPSSSNSENPTNICYSVSGVYNVTLIASNIYGSDTIISSNFINVINITPVYIDGETEVNICDKLNLSAIAGDGNFTWGPNQFLSCSNCQTTTVNPIQSQEYWVEYISTEGCKSYDTIKLNVDKTKTHYMPNALSPNGDGINDKVNFHGIGIQKFNLKIYNRIGELVFETEDKDIGWDGTYKDEEMNNNVFVYVVEIYFCDGEYLIEQGNISVIK